MSNVVHIAPAHTFSYDGARVNIYHADVGQGLPRHNHQYSHACVCCSGSCVVRKQGKEFIMDKTTQPINLVATEWHEIEALENNTVFINIFAENHMNFENTNIE